MRSDVYDNPADDPEAQKFLHTIAQAGKDQLPRMEFADWLEENGYANAAKGQRWAAKHGKHIAKPFDAHNLPPDAPAHMRILNPYLSGYYLGMRNNDTEYGKLTRPHRLPEVFHSALPTQTGPVQPGERSLLLARAINVADHTPEELAKIEAGHEQNFLNAAHRVNYDDDNEPVSRYKPNELGYQSDLRH